MITEQEKQFIASIEEDGSIAIIIKEKNGEPSNPKILYDGKDHALLVRNAESAVVLDYLNDELKPLLVSGVQVDVVEMKLPDLEDVVRSYTATVTRMAKLPLHPEDVISVEAFDKEAKEALAQVGIKL